MRTAVALMAAGAACAAGSGHLPGGEEPVALYHFDEGAGNVVHDSSPNHNDGRVMGDLGWAPHGIAGTALLLDGRDSVKIPSTEKLDLTGPHSVSAWIRGRASPMHFVEGFPDIDAFYFQVCGDTIYLATFSDPRNHAFKERKPTLRGGDNPHIYSGTIDSSLGHWKFIRRTADPFSGFEPKMEVVRDRIYYEYTGLDANKVQQIWTAESERNGSGYKATQRTSVSAKGNELPPDRPDLADSKKVGDTIYRVDHGSTATADGRTYIAYPAMDGHNVWQFTTAVCEGDRFQATQRTTDHGFIPSGIQVYGDRVYFLFPKGGDDFETYSHALIKGTNPSLKKVEGMYIGSTDLAGRDWKVVRRVAGPCPAGDPAAFQITNGKIHVIYAQLDPDDTGHSKLFTGVMDLDGGNFRKWQRTADTGFVGTSIAGGIQVVGNRVYCVFNQRLTDASYQEITKSGNHATAFGGWELWTAESNLDGSGWSAHRVTTEVPSVLVGYKGLVIEGAKRYLAPLDASTSHVPAYGHGPGMIGFDGANIVSKGDAFGVGVTGEGRPRGFVNAGQDYLFRGKGEIDASGAIADASAALSDNAWHHVAEVYDGHRLILYVDGTLAASTPYEASPAGNPFPVVIGDGFVGLVDEVGLYDRALSSDEVRQLYRRYR